MITHHDRVESPCVRNCCLNSDNICLGCFRSLHEIMHWAAADDVLRNEFLANAARRRLRIGSGASGAADTPNIQDYDS